MEKAYAQASGESYVFADNSRPPELAGKLVQLRPFEVSSFSLKTLACFIDLGILFLPQALFATAMGGACFILFANTSLDVGFVRALSVGTFMSTMILVQWLYFALSESSSKRATFGMSILGIKIQKEHGQGLNFFEANNRYWAWLFSSLFFGVNLIGLMSTKKKMLHDQVNNTTVVVES